MPKNPLPGEAFLRAVVHVAEAGNDWPLALRAVVGILRSRVDDVRDQREAIRYLPEWTRDSLNQRLRALEYTCSDFAETLDTLQSQDFQLPCLAVAALTSPPLTAPR